MSNIKKVLADAEDKPGFDFNWVPALAGNVVNRPAFLSFSKPGGIAGKRLCRRFLLDFML